MLDRKPLSMTRLPAKGILAFTLASAAMYAGACLPGGDDAIDPALADVIFEGSATHPALADLLAVLPTPDLARAPQITHPPTNSVLEAKSITTFEWDPTGPTAALDSPRAPLAPQLEPALSPATALAPALLPTLAPPAPPAALTWLRDLVGPERSAHAAHAPMLGPGYFLLFSTPEKPRILRVFTTHTSYTPDETAWAQLRTAGAWTKLEVVSAGFARDGLLTGTGPFEGDPIEFCIEEF